VDFVTNISLSYTKCCLNVGVVCTCRVAVYFYLPIFQFVLFKIFYFSHFVVYCLNQHCFCDLYAAKVCESNLLVFSSFKRYFGSSVVESAVSTITEIC